MAMDYKKTNASSTTETRDIKKLEQGAGNIYEATVIVSKRANQIAAEMKDELNQKLEEFASYTDNLEEIFENKEQIEISKFYERLPKPTLIALQEFLEGKIYFRNPDTGHENTTTGGFQKSQQSEE
jgi:DNA-directed RNA polymerase subunit K/omega